VGGILSRELLIELVYQSDLDIQYQKLRHLPGFTLLESRDHIKGRFDIVTAYPYERIVIRPNSKIKLEQLDYLHSLLHVQSTSYDLPFQGGAIGYVSYDFGAELLGIQSVPQPTLGTMPLLNLGVYDWAIITDHYLKKTTLYASNQHHSTSGYVEEVLALWNQPLLVEREFKLTQEITSLMSKEYYDSSFNEIQSALKQGRCYQVNFTQPFQGQYEGDPWVAYQKIGAKNPVPFSAFLALDEEEILSFSPERFLFYENGTLLTSPIKGTIRRSDNLIEDEQLKLELLSSAKNRAENIMIVDLLRNDLGKIAQPGTVDVVSLCEVQSYNGVHHLVSDIRAKSQTHISPLNLFLSCFPGGSITGAPKLESMRIINELELYSRGVYCGSIAYFSRHGRFDSSIAIRTVTAKNNIIHLAAGGGIVIDSDCDDEYRECYIKLKAIINGLK
jgi:para-aminobenzoate synthetase component I